MRTILDDAATGSKVTYRSDFLAKEAADLLMTDMLGQPWQTEAPIIMGKPRIAKRKTLTFGDPGTSYTYSGQLKIPNPWPDFLADTLGRLRQVCPFNFCLANYYPTGDAGISFHADDETDIVKGSPIIGLSLGVARDFVLKRKEGGHAVASVLLEHGSIVSMQGSTQAHYKHGLPPRKHILEPRVSLTFRVTSRV